VEKAISGEHRAFQTMKNLPAYQRSKILFRVVQLLKERKEELARIVAKEAGKPIRTAREGLERTIVTYQFAAEEAKRIYGETIPMDAAPGGEGRIGMTWREPLGVVVAFCIMIELDNNSHYMASYKRDLALFFMVLNT
jgi:acyl-CoA reductase-like NAD-dependent aldehyde dehydrogenase